MDDHHDKTLGTIFFCSKFGLEGPNDGPSYAGESSDLSFDPLGFFPGLGSISIPSGQGLANVLVSGVLRHSLSVAGVDAFYVTSTL